MIVLKTEPRRKEVRVKKAEYIITVIIIFVIIYILIMGSLGEIAAGEQRKEYN